MSSQASEARKRKGKDPADPEDIPLSRSILQEKEFPDNDVAQFYQIANATHGLGRLLERRNPANKNLVRAFYRQNRSNRSDIYSISLPGNRLVTVMDTDNIDTFYNLDPVPQCQYELNQNRVDARLRATIKKTIAKNVKNVWYQNAAGEANTWYIKRGNLKFEARIWLHFISFNVKPSGHLHEVPHNLALLIHLFMTGQKVRVREIIQDSIKTALRDQSKAMIFPHLISDLCIRHGAPDTPTDLYLPGIRFHYSELIRQLEREGVRVPRPRREGQDEDQEEEEEEPGSPPMSLHRVFDAVISLRDDMVEDRQARARFEQYVRESLAQANLGGASSSGPAQGDDTTDIPADDD